MSTPSLQPAELGVWVAERLEGKLEGERLGKERGSMGREKAEEERSLCTGLAQSSNVSNYV